MLQKLTKESEEKEVCIKLQDEKIAKLTKKLKKQLAPCVIKDSESEEEVKTSFHSEASVEGLHWKKGDKIKNGRSPRFITIEHIQDLIAATVKATRRSIP